MSVGDWDSARWTTLGKLITRSRGGISIKKREYGESGVPVLTKGDVKKFGGISHGGKYVPTEFVREQDWPLTKEGDFIITTRDLKPTAPFLGLVARVPSDQRFLVNQGATFFAIDEEVALPEFFVYWCNCRTFRDYVVSKKSGATQVHIRQDDLFGAPVPVVSKAEQKRIVSILDEAFSAIAKAKENAEKNLLSARELFESYLNRVFTQQGPGWQERELGHVCDFLNGYAFKSKDAVTESNTQLLRIGNLYGNRLDLNRKPAFYPDEFQSEHSRFVLKEGDLVMSLTGTKGKEDYGYVVVIPKCDHVLLLNQRVAKFVEINTQLVSRDYLLYFLRSRTFLMTLFPTANGTRQGNLSSTTIKTLPIPLCPIEEQKEIVRDMREISIRSQRLETIYTQKLANLDELKQSLLQKAFTGQLTAAAVSEEMAV